LRDFVNSKVLGSPQILTPIKQRQWNIFRFLLSLFQLSLKYLSSPIKQVRGGEEAVVDIDSADYGLSCRFFDATRPDLFLSWKVIYTMSRHQVAIIACLICTSLLLCHYAWNVVALRSIDISTSALESTAVPSGRKSLDIFVFTKRRPLQVFALLESLHEFCTGFNQVRLLVINC
jgi:hypothetical protein